MGTATDSELTTVEIDWRDGQVRWVSIRRDWKEQTGPRDLVREITRHVNNGLPVGSDWRDELSLSQVRLDELRAFNELVSDALEEERGVSKAPVKRAGRHWEATWSREQLLHLRTDETWMLRTTLQELSDSMTEAVQRPEMDDGSGPARDRLNRYLGRKT